ncbi:MAG: glutathione peroxidase, partial [Bacteroidales bacterium]|nr:glutathione peroxidase [Bacteroidales bacterium]
METIYDFSALDNKGREVNFEDYKGKVLLIVNTASKCGFT